jgi:hypothetical protein
LAASLVLWHGMKYVILENLFITTNMEPLPLFGRGNSKKKVYRYIYPKFFGTANEFITYEARP